MQKSDLIKEMWNCCEGDLDHAEGLMELFNVEANELDVTVRDLTDIINQIYNRALEQVGISVDDEKVSISTNYLDSSLSYDGIKVHDLKDLKETYIRNKPMELKGFFYDVDVNGEGRGISDCYKFPFEVNSFGELTDFIEEMWETPDNSNEYLPLTQDEFDKLAYEGTVFIIVDGLSQEDEDLILASEWKETYNLTVNP